MYHVIVNPVAGHGHSMALLPLLEAYFQADGNAYTIFRTESPMDARTLAYEACQQSSEGIIGIGGDGTLQEVVCGMYDASKVNKNGTGNVSTGTTTHTIKTPLGILPCGSGNDFVLTFTGKQKKRDDREVVRLFYSGIAQKRTKQLDIIRANDMAYLNIANIGLDARIVQNAAGLKKYYRHNAYLAAAFKSILQHKNTHMTIEINGEKLEGAFTLIALCNGQYYGGGLHVAPTARVDDGKITVCLISAYNRLQTMLLFPSVLVEGHVKLKGVRFIACERLRITLPKTESICMDGNLYDHTGVLDFEILPGALKIFIPEKYQ